MDSNSQDKTKSLMLDFKEKYEHDYHVVKVLDNPKRILPCGWNVALGQATGEAVVRVDAHTVFPKYFISNNVKELEAGEDIVGGCCESITRDNTPWQRTLLVAESSAFGAGVADFRRKRGRQYVKSLAFAMYRKKVFDEVGTYNEKLARTEDNEIHYRMKRAGYKFLLSESITTQRYARGTLLGLIKQKFENGKWVGITMKYSPRCFSPYHFAPICFVLAIIAGIILAVFNMPIPLIALGIAYGLFNLVSLIEAFRKNKFDIRYFFLPFILLVLHISYGVGTFIGFFKGLFMKK